MSAYKSDAETKMKKSIQSLVGEFNSIRTGRASTALFDKLMVEAYGSKTPLNQVANISIPEARLVVIQPWDKTVIGDIEKAILASELSLTPNNDGKVIRLNIPPLTEDRRKDLAKQSKATAENARVAIRNIRRDVNESLKKSLKDGDLTEDDNKKALDEIQKVTDLYIKEVDRMAAEKEKEIMEV
ncbi:MAG: ribosome recycling factor [Spirochaetes bacterium GWB1_48_6]|nr:MAG: ribosome recycling factor [Spirochaetes bacterium GWB1_48_6]